LLPFSTPTAGEEIELDDDDLVLVESLPTTLVASSPHPQPLGRGSDAGPAMAPARRVTASVSRRIIDESVAQDVAGECRSAIAAASREGHPSVLHVRPAALAAPPPLLGALAPASAPAVSRLPSVSPPPFVRTTTTTVARAPAVGHVTAMESAPPPAFVRRSSPMISVAAEAPNEPASVAPENVSERTPSPTVIVVRERPKAVWVVGAAAVGAALAVLASRLVMSRDASWGHPAAGTVTTTAPVLPSAGSPALVVAPAPVAASAKPSASESPTVMRFGDDEGVAFKAVRPPASLPGSASTLAAPATVAAAAPVAVSTAVPDSRASAVGPALPDGSLSLGGTPTTPTPTPTRTSPPSAPAPPAPEQAKKPRPLTPEQQLAEAQLKASMR